MWILILVIQFTSYGYYENYNLEVIDGFLTRGTCERFAEDIISTSKKLPIKENLCILKDREPEENK